MSMENQQGNQGAVGVEEEPCCPKLQSECQVTWCRACHVQSPMSKVSMGEWAGFGATLRDSKCVALTHKPPAEFC